MCGMRAAWLVGHNNSNEGRGSLRRVNCLALAIGNHMRVFGILRVTQTDSCSSTVSLNCGLE